MAVHPHACGENDHDLNQLKYAQYRYTPTPVGKTLFRNGATSSATQRLWWKTRSAASMVAVHPHACGENHWSAPFPQRYTPTPVGKTLAARRAEVAIPVHPHACGENAYLNRHRLACKAAVHPHACGGKRLDADPHVWGKPAQIQRMINDRRYTPTPVGKTFASPARWPGRLTGTPPRLWGKRIIRQASSVLGTPPRLFEVCIIHVAYTGTPPRLWGKRWLLPAAASVA